MKVICAWCKKYISGEGEEITHGICPKCKKAYQKELQQKIIHRKPKKKG